MADKVKVFGTWASPYSRRVEMALRLKGVEYEYIEEDLSNKSPQLLEYNPIHKKVPVLVHNGKPIVESLIILEYIDETWKNNPIMPQHPYDRAMARFWAKFIDETLMSMNLRKKMMEDREAAGKEFCELLKLLEDQLEGKEFFGGESVGYLDIAGNIVAFWLTVIGKVMGAELLTPESFPILHQWIEKLLTVDAVVQCVPPRDKHVAFMRKRLAAMAAAATE